MPKQSILITGCSSGIGLAAALKLKERGYQVFATARKQADLDHFSKLGFQGIPLDLKDAASIQQAVNHVMQLTNGTLDALFNNAGLLIAGATEDLTPAMIRHQFETNVFGPMELTRLILPFMRKQGHGRIIFNSSILGVITLPYYGAYNASKFAIEGFARTLRQEVQSDGIRVSIINPGPIKSSLRQHAYEAYQSTLQIKPDTTYRPIYQKMEKTYFSAERKDKGLTENPDAVIRELLYALESRNPKIHYFAGRTAKIMAILNKLLPESLMAWLLLKIAKAE